MAIYGLVAGGLRVEVHKAYARYGVIAYLLRHKGIVDGKCAADIAARGLRLYVGLGCIGVDAYRYLQFGCFKIFDVSAAGDFNIVIGNFVGSQQLGGE